MFCEVKNVPNLSSLGDIDVIKDCAGKQKQSHETLGRGRGQGLGTEDKDENNDLKPRTRPRTRDPSLRPRPKNSRSKPIRPTPKRPYHNDTLPSTGVTVIRFCIFWTSLVASYYWNSPTMQKILDKQKNWHFVTLAISDSVSLIFVTNFLLCCIYGQLQSCRPWNQIGLVILLTTMLCWFWQLSKIMVSRSALNYIENRTKH